MRLSADRISRRRKASVRLTLFTANLNLFPRKFWGDTGLIRKAAGTDEV